jgi:hypothetical protein
MTPEEEGQTLEEKVTEDRASAIKQKDALLALIVSPGWRIIAENFSKLADSLTEEVINTPLHVSPEFTVERQEFQKGQIKVARELVNYPQQLISIAEDVIESLKPAEVEEEDPDVAEDRAERKRAAAAVRNASVPAGDDAGGAEPGKRGK